MTGILHSQICGLSLLAGLAAVAGTPPPVAFASQDSSETSISSAEIPQDRQSVTRHSIELAGQEIDYLATAGTLVLKDEGEKARASIFYVAYIREDDTESEDRPVTFSFNGGPGSAAVWVHLGAFGPKKVLADPEGMPMRRRAVSLPIPTRSSTSPISSSSIPSAPAIAEPHQESTPSSSMGSGATSSRSENSSACG